MCIRGTIPNTQPLCSTLDIIPSLHTARQREAQLGRLFHYLICHIPRTVVRLPKPRCYYYYEYS